MKKGTIQTLAALASSMALAIWTFAAETEHGSMKDMEGKGHSAEMRHGQKIRDAKVEGHRFEYYLISMTEAMSGQEKMEMKGHDMTQMKSHHLMVYLMGPDGKVLPGARVGFWLTGPDGKDQKTMAMEMGEGYGADIDLKVKGLYKIKTKLVIGDKTLMDEFSYTVK